MKLADLNLLNGFWVVEMKILWLVTFGRCLINLGVSGLEMNRDVIALKIAPYGLELGSK